MSENAISNPIIETHRPLHPDTRNEAVRLAETKRLADVERLAEEHRQLHLQPLPRLIFASRWLQLPLYLGLILAQCVYVFLFMKELWELVLNVQSFDEQQIMLLVLGLIDVVMISNLLVMVIVGGYETFVSRLGLQHHPDQPEWLSHVNSGLLKVKLAMAIIGISSIHLLRTFIEANGLGTTSSLMTTQGVMWPTIIHCVFVLSAIGVATVDRLSEHRPIRHGASGDHGVH